MPTTKAAYWQEMKGMASHKLGFVAEMDAPESEHDVKHCLTNVFRHGSCHDKAEAVIEACEYMLACHMLKAHELP